MSHLFSPIKLRDLTLSNRVVVAPMCQYSAIDGVPNDWHLMHLGQFAVGGAGLVFTEATAVEPEGRITPGCPGLYCDEQQAQWERVIAFFRNYGAAKIGIQIAHAGRKASAQVPWDGGAPLTADNGAWRTVSASALPYADGWHTPHALSGNDLAQLKSAFVETTHRAVVAGFDVIELHAAHGYLMHQFLSPLSNQRADAFGGDLAGRMAFPLEVFEAMRIAAGNTPLGVRISATDWVEDSSWTITESTAFCTELKLRGCDFIDVSSAGNSPRQQIQTGPGYQAAFAQAIREATQLPVMALGQITDAVQAETILATGQADMVALARGMLLNPRWAWHAAETLGEAATFPPQYARSGPALRGEPIPGNPPRTAD
ncbi:MAG: NADH:flavin oxidoreductase/NADH oxidase [Pseudomonadota bacterium]